MMTRRAVGKRDLLEVQQIDALVSGVFALGPGTILPIVIAAGLAVVGVGALVGAMAARPDLLRRRPRRWPNTTVSVVWPASPASSRYPQCTQSRTRICAFRAVHRHWLCHRDGSRGNRGGARALGFQHDSRGRRRGERRLGACRATTAYRSVVLALV